MFRKILAAHLSLTVPLIIFVGMVIAAYHERGEHTKISKLAYQAVKAMAYSDETMQGIYATIDIVPKQIVETMKSQGAPTELVEKMEESLNNKIGKLKEEIDFNAIEDRVNYSYTSIFSDVYSEEEPHTLISFYQSLVGKQIIKKQSKLVKAMFPIQGEAVDEIMSKINELVIGEMSNIETGLDSITE